MCICWCVTQINYKMHGATIKNVENLYGSKLNVANIF